MLSSTCNQLTIISYFGKCEYDNCFNMLQECDNNILKRVIGIIYLFKQFHTVLEKNISRNALYSNVRLFVPIHKVEEWSKIGP